MCGVLLQQLAIVLTLVPQATSVQASLLCASNSQNASATVYTLSQLYVELGSGVVTVDSSMVQVENPFLEKYYAEPKQYALPMQLWLLKQRYVTFINAIKFVMEKGGSTAGVVLDRSVGEYLALVDVVTNLW